MGLSKRTNQRGAEILADTFKVSLSIYLSIYYTVLYIIRLSVFSVDQNKPQLGCLFSEKLVLQAMDPVNREL